MADDTLNQDLTKLTTALEAADDAYSEAIRTAIAAHTSDVTTYQDTLEQLADTSDPSQATAVQSAWQALQASRTTAMTAVTAAKTARTNARSTARDTFKATLT